MLSILMIISIFYDKKCFEDLISFFKNLVSCKQIHLGQVPGKLLNRKLEQEAEALEWLSTALFLSEM